MWSPLNLEHQPALWVASNFITDADGTAVSKWEDRSGWGHHMVQSEADDKPEVVDNTWTPHNLINFNDSDTTWLYCEEFVPEMEVGTGDFLVASTFIQSSTDTNHQQIIQKKAYPASGGANAGLLLRQQKGWDGYSSLTGSENDRTAQICSDSTVIRDGVYTGEDYYMHVYVFYRRSGTLYTRLDGNAKTNISATQNLNDGRATPSAKITIGNLGDSLDANKIWDGYMGEVIMVPGTVGDSDIARLEGYLAHKWTDTSLTYFDKILSGGGGIGEGNLGFPATHRYKNFAPSGVLGINLSSGDNSCIGRCVGEVSGDCGWEASEIMEVQRS